MCLWKLGVRRLIAARKGSGSFYGGRASAWALSGGEETTPHLPEHRTTDDFAVLSRRGSGALSKANSLLLNLPWLGAGFQADFLPSIGANQALEHKQERPWPVPGRSRDRIRLSVCLREGRAVVKAAARCACWCFHTPRTESTKGTCLFLFLPRLGQG